MKECDHDNTDDGAACLWCRDCGARGHIHPGAMRALVTGRQIDGPLFWWVLPDGTIEVEA